MTARPAFATPKTIIVVGGGLAGLAAAWALAVSGRAKPVVLEADSRLGGRAASWRGSRGELIEVGLHVCFPHYRQLLGLLDKIGGAHGLSWGDSGLNYVHAEGRIAPLRFPGLPPPLHGAMAIARHAPLAARDRLSALLAAAEATLSTPGWRSRYEAISFAEWGRRRGLSRRVLSTVFEPIVGGLTFLRGDQVSARAMLDYIHAVGRSSTACRIGRFRAGTGDVLVAPLAEEVKRRGGELHTRAPVTRLLFREGRVAGVHLPDGSTVEADLVIAALPSHAVAAILPEAARGNPALRDVASLLPVPAASVMVWFDRRLGGPSGIRLSPGCVFNTWADLAEVLPELADSSKSVLQLVVAPVDSLGALDDAALSARVVSDLRRLLPSARSARVERSLVVRTPCAVHAVVPGSHALRPDVDVGIPGLLLAGDYLRTGHNPNMESAVTSGLRAARLGLEAIA
jgi:uncharacterized protein with NAD-binding domain and iron-sulfur cluster